jgi:hypothetical protein
MQSESLVELVERTPISATGATPVGSVVTHEGRVGVVAYDFDMSTDLTWEVGSHGTRNGYIAKVELCCPSAAEAAGSTVWVAAWEAAKVASRREELGLPRPTATDAE